MDYVQELLVKHDWQMLCWDGRYSGGIWILIAPAQYQANGLSEAIEIDFEESNEMATFLEGKGSWLPIVVEKDLVKALDKLNIKAKEMVEREDLREEVYDAFNRMILGEKDMSLILKEWQ